MKEKKKEDLRQYRTLRMPLLVLMGLLALIGIVVTVILKHFF